LIDLHELLIPLLDVRRLPSGIGIILVGRGGVMSVMVAPFNHLFENGGVDIGNRDRFFHGLFAEIADHVLDKHRSLSDFAVWTMLA